MELGFIVIGICIVICFGMGYYAFITTRKLWWLFLVPAILLTVSCILATIFYYLFK